MSKTVDQSIEAVFDYVADYASREPCRGGSLHPAGHADQLRAAFDIGLPQEGRAPLAVIRDLIAAAEPGLLGTRKAGFMGWVIGGSHPVGVAADWLTALWGQNAGIYQASPAAAIAEEAVERWLLDLLGLPDEASVGLTTGATMAGFTCLATARDEVLRRAGFDRARCGLAGAPRVTVYLGEEAHSTIFAALGYLGFGTDNFCHISADRNGAMDARALACAMERNTGPAIVIAQAGHINTGAFDDLRALSATARRHGAWLHVDGAFGLWVRASPGLAHLADGAELADSWSVDGHKWLQVPYDCGFAIVADRQAHRRAMDITAGYLPCDPSDGRNPTQYGPELSRRARGFFVWAVLQSLGRNGISEMIDNHCTAAKDLAARLADIDEAHLNHAVVLNQLAVSFGMPGGSDALTRFVCEHLNGTGRYFLKTATWRDATVFRFSFSGASVPPSMIEDLVAEIRIAIRNFASRPPEDAGMPAPEHHFSG